MPHIENPPNPLKIPGPMSDIAAMSTNGHKITYPRGNVDAKCAHCGALFSVADLFKIHNGRFRCEGNTDAPQARKR